MYIKYSTFQQQQQAAHSEADTSLITSSASGSGRDESRSRNQTTTQKIDLFKQCSDIDTAYQTVIFRLPSQARYTTTKKSYSLSVYYVGYWKEYL